MDTSIFDQEDLAVIGAAIITAALVTNRASTTVDSAKADFKTIADAILDWFDEE